MHEWSSGDDEAIEIWRRLEKARGRSSEVGVPARASAMPQPMPRPETLER